MTRKKRFFAIFLNEKFRDLMKHCYFRVEDIFLNDFQMPAGDFRLKLTLFKGIQKIY